MPEIRIRRRRYGREARWRADLPPGNGINSGYIESRSPEVVERLAAKRCNEPGCDCAGWVPSDDSQHRAGHAAEPYMTLWITTDNYLPAFDGDTGDVLGVTLAGVPVLRVRPPKDTPEHAALELLTAPSNPDRKE